MAVNACAQGQRVGQSQSGAAGGSGGPGGDGDDSGAKGGGRGCGVLAAGQGTQGAGETSHDEWCQAAVV